MSRKKEDPALLRELIEIKDKHPYYGWPRVHAVLRRKGFLVNGKKVFRLMKALRLTVGRKIKQKRLRPPAAQHMPEAIGCDDVWALDFVFDRLADGTPFRCFTMIDTHSRVVPGIHVAKSMAGFSAIDYLERLKKTRKLPRHFVLDNGTEFVNRAFYTWCEANCVSLHFIDPGKPVQNAYIESFNGKFRKEFLQQRSFTSVADARAQLERWLKHYNEARPHSSLDYLTPKEFADQETRVLDGKNNLLALKMG